MGPGTGSVEAMELNQNQPKIDPSYWQSRRVLITGNTGLKGAWLALWLEQLGAKVFGYSLAPASTPNMFDLIYARKDAALHTGDVRDLEDLKRKINEFEPELIIHMAAQSLVRESYADPINTYSTNVMGTVNLLEAARTGSSVRAIICVTSDKCYENNGETNSFVEGDPLGGHDPYSSSKGCAELVTAAYRNSYFNEPGSPAVASARAGNVIGGGDWAENRLIPDLIRGILSDQAAVVRNPTAVRPWQHVLDCLSGYLVLARGLLDQGAEMSGAWNFGPSGNDSKPAQFVADRIVRLWGDNAGWERGTESGPHEAGFLSLDCSKAHARLAWQPKLSLEEALKLTVEWYRGYSDGEDVRALSICQISRYQAL